MPANNPNPNVSTSNAIKSFGRNIKSWLADKSPMLLYGGCLALTLAPAIQMLRSGNPEGALAQVGLLGAAVGSNLAANELQKWADETDPIRAAASSLVEIAQNNPAARRELDRVIEVEGLIPRLQAELTDPQYREFTRRLVDQLKAAGSEDLIKVALEGGVVASGDDAISVGPGGVHVGGDSEGSITTARGAQDSGTVATGKNARAIGAGGVYVGGKSKGNINTRE